MMRKVTKSEIIMMIVMFIVSTSLFWDIIKIFKPEIISEPFQLLFSISYSIMAILMTFDIDAFNAFWENHKTLKAIFEIILHYVTYSIVGIAYLLLWIPDILSVGNKDKTKDMIQTDKTRITQQVNNIDNLPLIVKILPLFALLAFVELFLQHFQIVPTGYYFLIGDVSSFFTSLLSLFIVCLNITEKKK